VFKQGQYRRAHFAHYARQSDCANAGESAAHLALKAAALRRWPDATALEVTANGRRADAILSTAAGPIALEFQQSALSEEDWRQRTTDLNAAGLPVLWVWHASRVKVNEGRPWEVRLPKEMLACAAESRGDLIVADGDRWWWVHTSPAETRIYEEFSSRQPTTIVQALAVELPAESSVCCSPQPLRGMWLAYPQVEDVPAALFYEEERYDFECEPEECPDLWLSTCLNAAALTPEALADPGKLPDQDALVAELRRQADDNVTKLARRREAKAAADARGEHNRRRKREVAEQKRLLESHQKQRQAAARAEDAFWNHRRELEEYLAHTAGGSDALEEIAAWADSPPEDAAPETDEFLHPQEAPVGFVGGPIRVVIADRLLGGLRVFSQYLREKSKLVLLNPCFWDPELVHAVLVLPEWMEDKLTPAEGKRFHAELRRTLSRLGRHLGRCSVMFARPGPYQRHGDVEETAWLLCQSEAVLAMSTDDEALWLRRSGLLDTKERPDPDAQKRPVLPPWLSADAP
jgi:hypothetical protein